MILVVCSVDSMSLASKERRFTDLDCNVTSSTSNHDYAPSIAKASHLSSCRLSCEESSVDINVHDLLVIGQIDVRCNKNVA